MSILIGIRLSRWNISLLQNRVQCSTWTLPRKICLQVLKLPIMVPIKQLHNVYGYGTENLNVVNMYLNFDTILLTVVAINSTANQLV